MVAVPKINSCTSLVRTKAKSVLNDVKSKKQYYKNHAKMGWKQGAVVSKRNNYGQIKTLAAKVKGAWKHTKIDPNDYPVVGCALGMGVPLPGVSVLGLGLGYLLKLLKKVPK